MFSCDYNGWADVPEEEREAIDEFEAVNSMRFTPTLTLVETIRNRVTEVVERRAA
jgi:hypothetical protein